ncbi:MAG: MFS transporter [Myxococcota bacterium]
MDPAPVPAADPQAPRTRRDLHSIVADGVSFSAMVGLGETYVPAFALAAGLGEVVAGLIATLPMLAGALFQLVTPWAVHRLRSYRRWVVLCAALQALSFLPLIAGALLGRIGLGWVAAATVAYWGFGMATSPAWNAWVTSLVPEPIRARFFASRTRAAHATLFVAILLGGLLLDRGRAASAEFAAFGLLFVAAMAARLLSAWFLSRQSEAPDLAAGHRALGPGAIARSIRDAGSGRVLAYLLGMHAAVNVAAPYFTPYMLGPLDLSYAEFMLLTAAAFLARLLVLPVLGSIAHVQGTRPILWWGAVGIVPLPVLWLVSDAFAYLFALQIFAGAAWAALEFATLLTFFEGIPEDDRTSVLSAFNLASAASIGFGALCGSLLFVSFDGTAYAWIFCVSSAGRLLVLGVLRGIHPARRLLAMRLRALAVRPSAGAIERPILASVGEEEGAAKPPGA